MFCIGLVGASQPAPPSPSLDALSSAAKTSANGLYSLKQLLTTYTGPVITVRRTDNTN
jgi:hypothetical protein